MQTNLNVYTAPVNESKQSSFPKFSEDTQIGVSFGPRLHVAVKKWSDEHEKGMAERNQHRCAMFSDASYLKNVSTPDVLLLERTRARQPAPMVFMPHGGGGVMPSIETSMEVVRLLDEVADADRLKREREKKRIQDENEHQLDSIQAAYQSKRDGITSEFESEEANITTEKNRRKQRDRETIDSAYDDAVRNYTEAKEQETIQELENVKNRRKDEITRDANQKTSRLKTVLNTALNNWKTLRNQRRLEAIDNLITGVEQQAGVIQDQYKEREERENAFFQQRIAELKTRQTTLRASVREHQGEAEAAERALSDMNRNATAILERDNAAYENRREFLRKKLAARKTIAERVEKRLKKIQQKFEKYLKRQSKQDVRIEKRIASLNLRLYYIAKLLDELKETAKYRLDLWENTKIIPLRQMDPKDPMFSDLALESRHKTVAQYLFIPEDEREKMFDENLATTIVRNLQISPIEKKKMKRWSRIPSPIAYYLNVSEEEAALISKEPPERIIALLLEVEEETVKKQLKGNNSRDIVWDLLKELQLNKSMVPDPAEFFWITSIFECNIQQKALDADYKPYLNFTGALVDFLDPFTPIDLAKPVTVELAKTRAIKDICAMWAEKDAEKAIAKKLKEEQKYAKAEAELESVLSDIRSELDALLHPDEDLTKRSEAHTAKIEKKIEKKKIHLEAVKELVRRAETMLQNEENAIITESVKRRNELTADMAVCTEKRDRAKSLFENAKLELEQSTSDLGITAQEFEARRKQTNLEKLQNLLVGERELEALGEQRKIVSENIDSPNLIKMLLGELLTKYKQDIKNPESPLGKVLKTPEEQRGFLDRLLALQGIAVTEGWSVFEMRKKASETESAGLQTNEIERVEKERDDTHNQLEADFTLRKAKLNGDFEKRRQDALDAKKTAQKQSDDNLRVFDQRLMDAEQKTRGLLIALENQKTRDDEDVRERTDARLKELEDKWKVEDDTQEGMVPFEYDRTLHQILDPDEVRVCRYICAQNRRLLVKSHMDGGLMSLFPEYIRQKIGAFYASMS